MRRTCIPIFISLLVSALAASLPRADAAGFLHAQGHDIVDEHGQKVMLRGVGLGNWLLPEGYMWRFGNAGDRPRKIEQLVRDLLGEPEAARFWSEYRAQYITQADIQRIAALGFNSVRPALNARLFLTEEEKPVFVEEGFALLDRLVAWCKQAGIYVIIDMHAAPGGQTGANIDDSRDDQPRLFMDKKYQDNLVKLWTRLAQRYQNEPAVAAYDLLNEPLPGRTGAAAKYKDQLEPLYQRVTRALRTLDHQHMITLEGADWANNWSVFTTRFDDNLVYQFHFYCWDRPDKLNRIDQYLADRQRLNAPVWVGETGEKDNAIYWATTQYFEANNIGWSFWPWKKMDTRNTPYSIKTPLGWDAIAACSRRGDAVKPSRAVARKAFAQLLENVRLENCVYFPEVVNAILRRVPGKVEAENYEPGGLNGSYFVHNRNQKSKFYRTAEPVLVEPVGGENARERGQAIKLSADEWTAYTVTSLEDRSYKLALRVKSEESALVQVFVNERALEPVAAGQTWSEVQLKPVELRKGSNHLKLLVKSGTASVDWVSFE